MSHRDLPAALLGMLSFLCGLFACALLLPPPWRELSQPLAALLFLTLGLPAVGYLLLAWFIYHGSRQAVLGAMLLLLAHTLAGLGVVAAAWWHGVLDPFSYGLFAVWLVVTAVTVLYLRRALLHFVEASRGFDLILRVPEPKADLTHSPDRAV